MVQFRVAAYSPETYSPIFRLPTYVPRALVIQAPKSAKHGCVSVYSSKAQTPGRRLAVIEFILGLDFQAPGGPLVQFSSDGCAHVVIQLG